ncbi:AIR synthase-related protein [Sorangium sp. So ce327]|uniref:AIR synthase-related protein n=1 Tax=Sorangium sp. So ce327 TaxID=3133301 RepID=UPI003F5E3DB3
MPEGVVIAPRRVRPGDAVLVSGDVGRHGIAVLSVREALAFEEPVESDCAPVQGLTAALLASGIDVHCLRDPTRGGLAAVLNEIARDASVHVEVEEAQIPVEPAVLGACELLGLDPLYVACEGGSSRSCRKPRRSAPWRACATTGSAGGPRASVGSSARGKGALS